MIVSHDLTSTGPSHIATSPKISGYIEIGSFTDLSMLF